MMKRNPSWGDYIYLTISMSLERRFGKNPGMFFYLPIINLNVLSALLETSSEEPSRKPLLLPWWRCPVGNLKKRIGISLNGQYNLGLFGKKLYLQTIINISKTVLIN